MFSCLEMINLLRTVSTVSINSEIESMKCDIYFINLVLVLVSCFGHCFLEKRSARVYSSSDIKIDHPHVVR